MTSPKSLINLSCLHAVFTNCTSFKPLCTKNYVPSNGRGSLCKNFFLPFSAWLYLFTINRAPHELFKNGAIFSRFGIAPRPLAPARAMKSRTCAVVFQPCFPGGGKMREPGNEVGHCCKLRLEILLRSNMSIIVLKFKFITVDCIMVHVRSMFYRYLLTETGHVQK